jgi:hypothetical protein
VQKSLAGGRPIISIGSIFTFPFFSFRPTPPLLFSSSFPDSRAHAAKVSSKMEKGKRKKSPVELATPA